jgi:signal transduction histidine kinase
MSTNRRHTITTAALGLGLVLTFLLSVSMWFHSNGLREEWNRLSTTTLELERSIGYVGFIHNFKNAVLRPSEPQYIAAAQADYEAAQSSIATLRALAEERGLPYDLTALAIALRRYNEFLSLLDESPRDSSNIHEIDERVRVPDSIARRELDQLTQALRQSYSEAYWPARNALWFGLAGFQLFSMLMIQQTRIHSRLKIADEARRAQAQRLQHERLHNAALERTNAQLAQINREQAEMAYAISHDLKSPTNTAAMLAEALAEELASGAPEDVPELMEDLKTVLARMGLLIDDMLNYTRTFGDESKTIRVSLDKILEGVLGDLRADIFRYEARIETAPLGDAIGDPQQLRHLFQNLIANAMKFHRPDTPPEIHVEPAEAEEGFVAFRVRDNGIGIPEEHFSRIFGLFGRLHRHEQYAGTGLGLPICMRVAKAHGGGITVSSQPGAGSIFTVTLKTETL